MKLILLPFLFPSIFSIMVSKFDPTMADSHNPFPSSSAFPNSIGEKLDDSNFLLWRQQIEPVMKSHQLQRFVVNLMIPPRFPSDVDR